MTTLREALNTEGHGLTFHKSTREIVDDSIRYGSVDDVQDPAKADLVGHRCLVGSDYSGGALVRANVQDARGLVSEDSGLVVDVYGGHGTFGLYFRLDVDGDEDEIRALASALAGLDDYPILDESTLSEIQAEDEAKAWAGGEAKEFRKELEKRFDVEFVHDEEALSELWRIADNGSGLVEHEETGPYFRTEKAAGLVPPALAFYFLKVEQSIETALERPDEARRILRLVRIGEHLKTIRNRIGAYFRGDADPARRKVHEAIIRADFDVGDYSAELDATAFENVPCRSFVATFKRWRSEPTEGDLWAGREETHRITFDPIYPGGRAVGVGVAFWETDLVAFLK